MAKRRRSSAGQAGLQTATKGPPHKRSKVHPETPVVPTKAQKPASSAKKGSKQAPGTGFSDHNKSWLKRKAQENHSDDELVNPSGSDSEDDLGDEFDGELGMSHDSDDSGSNDSQGEEESSDQQSSDADQDDDPLGGQTFDMSDDDDADVSPPESGDDSPADSEPELADTVGKINGGALQLMSDDDEGEEGDAGVAGLEGEVDSEDEDPSAESSSDPGSDDDDDEFGSDEDDTDQDEDEGDEPLLTIEKQAKILDRKRAKAEKAAAAEAAHIGTDMETNMEEAERFVLPSGLEVEAAGRGPPDLALINRRIKETVRLLESFKMTLAKQAAANAIESSPRSQGTSITPSHNP